MDLAGKRVVVVGLARSGVAAARFLEARGADVVATDSKRPVELEAEALSLEKEGVRLELGGHRESTFLKADLVVVSPGVPWSLPELEAARRGGVLVMAETELGYRFIKGMLVAVTGTKGKSTTTSALGAMLKAGGRDVRVGGNIGQALTSLLDKATEKTVFVLEVSSFQLEGTHAFHPKVAVFLNLSADHLDRHLSFEDYASAKAKIFRNQTEEDFAVVNADDPGVLALARAGRARLLPFGLSGAAEGAFFEEGEARLRWAGRTETLFLLRDLALPGPHLAQDVLAAGAAARLLGASAGDVARAVRAFRGAEHVLERVAEIRGVSFFNDSKATNIAAAKRSIEAFPSGVVVILGGRFKGGDFADLKDVLATSGRAVIAIGEARERIVQALSGVVPVFSCHTLGEAVERALESARAGDTVVLAPGCSSFDMFEDYAHRGRAFKDEVLRLRERKLH